ncbi:hypothetical protein GLAREA_05850 [Glarea lozoyensis ATCC 20868]|uniref:2EXR domain-containing protein n=1 Tax=Glarea lozoyensis (strain ATCC 20868 / MF5171) TaxID=1116229 RepID=S3E345_GLAL2|nr:uncharacterized protein GLAREA_05850 [Glarea lozoyensis ATCC 20868]EPE32838.1 hypothetical protein GLAREA_05850 [Glarea lozoyensis ATCC 20868]
MVTAGISVNLPSTIGSENTSTPLTEFKLFPTLPTELRLMIFECIIPASELIDVDIEVVLVNGVSTIRIARVAKRRIILWAVDHEARSFTDRILARKSHSLTESNAQGDFPVTFEGDVDMIRLGPIRNRTGNPLAHAISNSAVGGSLSTLFAHASNIQINSAAPLQQTLRHRLHLLENFSGIKRFYFGWGNDQEMRRFHLSPSRHGFVDQNYLRVDYPFAALVTTFHRTLVQAAQSHGLQTIPEVFGVLKSRV